MKSFKGEEKNLEINLKMDGELVELLEEMLSVEAVGEIFWAAQFRTC